MASYQVLNDLIWYIMEIHLQHGDKKLPWSIVKRKTKFKILNHNQIVFHKKNTIKLWKLYAFSMLNMKNLINRTLRVQNGKGN
jgi:hypothetical protein